MGVARNINCHHLLNHLLSQAVLMSLVQISHYCLHCHHQVCLLHHQICHTCCHTLFRCCVNLSNIVFKLYWSVFFLTIGLYHQFVLLLIQLGRDKNNQLEVYWTYTFTAGSYRRSYLCKIYCHNEIISSDSSPIVFGCIKVTGYRTPSYVLTRIATYPST